MLPEVYVSETPFLPHDQISSRVLMQGPLDNFSEAHTELAPHDLVHDVVLNFQTLIYLNTLFHLFYRVDDHSGIIET